MGDTDSELGAGPVEELTALSEVRFADLVRARQTSPLPTPRAGDPCLPLGELDPEVLERRYLPRRVALATAAQVLTLAGIQFEADEVAEMVEQQAGDLAGVAMLVMLFAVTADWQTGVQIYANPKGYERRAPDPF